MCVCGVHWCDSACVIADLGINENGESMCTTVCSVLIVCGLKSVPLCSWPNSTGPEHESNCSTLTNVDSTPSA